MCPSKLYDTAAASLKLLYDFIESLVESLNFAAPFIDLSKAFDTVDHAMLMQRFISMGLADPSRPSVCFGAASQGDLNVFRQKVSLLMSSISPQEFPKDPFWDLFHLLNMLIVFGYVFYRKFLC